MKYWLYLSFFVLKPIRFKSSLVWQEVARNILVLSPGFLLSSLLSIRARNEPEESHTPSPEIKQYKRCNKFLIQLLTSFFLKIRAETYVLFEEQLLYFWLILPVSWAFLEMKILGMKFWRQIQTKFEEEKLLCSSFHL